MRWLVGCWHRGSKAPQFTYTLQTPAASIATEGVWIDSAPDRITLTLTATGIREDLNSQVVITDSSLELYREPFGRTELFWTVQAEAVWFSSRLDLLIELLGLREADTQALYLYTCFSYIPTPLSAVTQVHSVVAGERLTFSNSLTPQRETVVDWRYPHTETLSEGSAVSRLQGLLQESIEVLTPCQQKYGVFLSGGLDSSVTAALLRQRGIRPVAYTLDFGEYGVSEIEYAQAVADHLGLKLRRVSASPDRLSNSLHKTVSALDQPYGDGVTVPLYLLAEAARNDGCEVVFNGEGGDQLFAGWTNKPLIASEVYGRTQSRYQEYLKTFHRFSGLEHQIFSDKMLSQIAQTEPLDWLRDALNFEADFLSSLRRANLKLKGAQNIQPRATRLAHAHNLDVRSPFCYEPLVEILSNCKGDLLLRGACEKYLLKRAVEHLLPKEVVWREKRGMGVPLTQLLLGPLWRRLCKLLDPSVLSLEGRFIPDLALKLATGRLSGQMQGRRIGELLWLLLVWQVWRSEVLKEDLNVPFYNSFWLPPLVWQWKYRLKEYTS